MKKLYLAAALAGAVMAFACAAYGQQIGQSCPADPTNLKTVRSKVLTEGAIECIPDASGNYYWQPMGGGIARYDNTDSCSVAGTMRWNGNVMQFCNGSTWQSLGGGKTLVVGDYRLVADYLRLSFMWHGYQEPYPKNRSGSPASLYYPVRLLRLHGAVGR